MITRRRFFRFFRGGENSEKPPRSSCSHDRDIMIWRFPKGIGLPPVIIYFCNFGLGFSHGNKPSSELGVPTRLWKTPYIPIYPHISPLFSLYFHDPIFTRRIGELFLPTAPGVVARSSEATENYPNLDNHCKGIIWDGHYWSSSFFLKFKNRWDIDCSIFFNTRFRPIDPAEIQ